ncbi:hypothetical protein AWB80_08466 [Caballeronia pedi]|uniref:Uncharacterized protein n=1 Tax=Caballeronia pedi TaxID=1777141 RepID=A0A158E863_9BURK|nr:hypothetical protein AWB80_08466 [Caballeronia pedi]
MIASGADGAQVKDGKDAVHRVPHDSMTHKWDGDDAPRQGPSEAETKSDPNAQPTGASSDALKPEKVKQKKNGNWQIDSAINGAGGQKVGFAETEESPDAVTMRTVMIEDENARGKGYALNAYRDTINYALESGKAFHSDKEVSAPARKVYDRLKKMGYQVEQSKNVSEDDYGRLHSKDKGPVFTITGKPMRKAIGARRTLLILKSMIAGYTRRDGVFVQPHSDKRARRAPAADSRQMVLFEAPKKKPLPPNKFKGLDPVKSTGDLFEDEKYDWEHGHGHVRPRADGARARCGAERSCSVCQHERKLDDAEKARA